MHVRFEALVIVCICEKKVFVWVYTRDFDNENVWENIEQFLFLSCANDVWKMGKLLNC
jgi:hypothetical protein